MIIYVAIILIVILIILLSILGIYFFYRNRHEIIPASPLEFTDNVWSDPETTPGSKCQLYNFPSNEIFVPSLNKNVFLPANPNFKQIPSLVGEPISISCLQPDQIVAREVKRICLGSQSLCRKLNGDYVTANEEEIFFTNQGCPAINPCQSQLATVSLNYQAPQLPFSCLENNNSLVRIEQCDPSKLVQQFEITRRDPTSNQIVSDGLLAQLKSRNTNLCLDISAQNENILWTPGVTCQGVPPSNVVGKEVILAPCSGFKWMFLPSLNYCIAENDCKNSPQQIIYLGNINPQSIPVYNGKGYDNITGNYALIKWIIDNQLPSLFWGNNGNQVVAVFNSNNFDSTTCQGKSIIAQYLNYTLFNKISSIKGCLTPEEICYPL